MDYWVVAYSKVNGGDYRFTVMDYYYPRSLTRALKHLSYSPLNSCSTVQLLGAIIAISTRSRWARWRITIVSYRQSGGTDSMRLLHAVAG